MESCRNPIGILMESSWKIPLKFPSTGTCLQLFYLNCRLLKPGMDGHYAVVLDLVWDSASSDSTPRIDVETIAVAGYDPDEELANDVARAYSVLDPLLKVI